MNILEKLKSIPAFTGVPDKELIWLATEGTLIHFKVNDYLFQPGNPIDQLLIILEGHVVLKFQQGNNYRVIGSFEKNDISGYLPYSRASIARGYAEVVEPTTVLKLHKDRFRDMILHQEDLTTALVHVMSSRIRQFTKVEQQNDKMMALGKLSAGLAHELNNPSAAIIRSVQSLSGHLRLIPENFKSVIKIKMTDDQVDQVNELLMQKVDVDPPKLSMMDRSSREDELLDWLDEKGVVNGEEISETLVSMGFELNDLEQISEITTSTDLPKVLRWINQVLNTEKLVREIEEASKRINVLVSSVKSYTHMDQAPEKSAVDLHLGIDNTLTMLNHKIRKNNIEVIRDFKPDLVKPTILVSEMNQVWTNLIDNAIDAMETSQERKLTIRTTEDGSFVNVFIADTGVGIPEAIQESIFDPFFTTKAVGKGTGLGMEVVYQIVVKQHHGSVSFESRPGHTEFKVCFPIK